MKTTVAVQIVNYKTKAFLQPLIESILDDVTDHKELNIEINIIDNASGDDLHDIEKKYQLRHVRVFTASQNKGFGAGHNILATKTNADYLLLLNPDTLFITPQTIACLLDTARKYNAAVVGPRLLTPRVRNTTSLSAVPYSGLQQQWWDHGRDSIWRYKQTHDISEVKWVSGAVFLIERKTFTAISGFDERFFLYYEEVDMCRQLRNHHAKIIYDPSVEVLHYGSAVASKYSKHMLQSFLRYQLKTLEK